MFSMVVGLSLLAVVERALLEGTPVGTPGPAGNDLVLQTPTSPVSRPRPRPSTRPGQSRPPVPSTSTPPDAQALTSQIRRITLEQRGTVARRVYGAAPERAPLVRTDRFSPDRLWAFGTTAIPVPQSSPAPPELAFFAARWTEGRWTAALSGTAVFANLLSRMPVSMMSPSESAALARYNFATASQAAANAARGTDRLMLPWSPGTDWTMGSAAPSGEGRPLGALAFWGGDGEVQSAGDGRLYRFCGDGAGRALVMIVHRSGVSSLYYRMRGVTQLRSGSVVRRGEPLGRTGAERPCGGAPAPRALVQFSLRRGAAEVSMNGAGIGGWRFGERADPAIGYAERGDTRVLLGAPLANLGSALPPLPGQRRPVAPGPNEKPKDATNDNRSPRANDQQ
ncbi:hypothetical protein [Spirillospora sp. CA-294931]|uniref:hypothetical protein n=1 Tax=Spirillospora sp. CA-294931 TaxID=3240042 RepID=UPI003D8D3A72